MYKFIYAIPSESVHGSWYESLEFNFVQNDDGTYTIVNLTHPGGLSLPRAITDVAVLNSGGFKGIFSK